MAFFVSRQRYYEDNILAFEIAIGGTKFAGKDVLPIKFAGECKNLVSPIDAVNVAIRVIDEWHTANHYEPKHIALVNRDGKGSKEYFDPFNKRDVAQLEKWAQAVFAQMPKCANCGRCIGNTVKAYQMDEMPNKVFCQEICLASNYRHFYGKEPPRVQSNKDKKQTP